MKTLVRTMLAVAVGASMAGGAKAQQLPQRPIVKGETIDARNGRWMAGWIDPAQPKPPYRPADTPLGTGPYKAVMATLPGAEEFVAYFPADLAALGARKLPVVVWGNGSCTYTGNKYRHFLTDIASYGYFVLAGGPMSAPDGGAAETVSMDGNNALVDPDLPPTPAAPADPARRQVTAELLSQGIDWAVAENRRPGSRLFGKLDTANIAVMGHSCGGGLAYRFAGDARVKTVALWSGASRRTPELRNALNKPLLLFAGDPRFDISYMQALAEYEGLRRLKTRQPVFYAWRNNVTHLGTYRQADGGELAPVATAWLDWQLKGDRNAARVFTGDDCALCVAPSWHVERLNIQ